jgi:2-methylcitrate dehydratase PrpD
MARADEIFSFTARCVAGDIPGDVLHQARRCLLDLLGVAAAGRQTALSRIISGHTNIHFAAGPGIRSVPLLFAAGDPVCSPAGAALANGMTIDAFDAHDGHPLTKGHAGCGILPALFSFAMAEESDMPLERFCRLIVAGYEIAIRAGIALHATAPDYHTSGAWVSVGAAAIGSHVLGLDDGQSRHALGIAEYHGPRSQMMRCIDHPTMLKDGSGWGAMAGVSAAYLARDGFTGEPALTVEDSSVGDLWADLGRNWRMMEMYFKPYPVCRWAQPAVEAVLDALRGRSVENIRSIRIHTFHEATRLAARRPRDTEQAQYSLPFPVAAAALRGRLGFAEVSDEACLDPEILTLADRVELIDEPAFSSVFPADRIARAEIVFQGGDTVRSTDMRARGDATAPLPDEEIADKFRTLMHDAGCGHLSGGLESFIFNPPAQATVADLAGLVRL